MAIGNLLVDETEVVLVGVSRLGHSQLVGAQLVSARRR